MASRQKGTLVDRLGSMRPSVQRRWAATMKGVGGAPRSGRCGQPDAVSAPPETSAEFEDRFDFDRGIHRQSGDADG